MTEMVKATKAQIVEMLKADGGLIRGQSHGASGTNVGNIAGCISLKQRKNAVHYVAVLKVSEMDAEAPNTVKLTKANAGAQYVVHCFAHGRQVAVPNRSAGMHTARISGAGTTAKAGAKAVWCNGCKKAMQSDDVDANE